ncbi:MAG: transcription-repair coupling factor [Micrococcaceae bacterium]
MRFSAVVSALAEANVFKNYFTVEHNDTKFKIVEGAHAPSLTYYQEQQQSPVLVVTATTREAENLVAELSDYVAEENIVYFPNLETLPHERLSPNNQTITQRIKALKALKNPETKIIISPLRAVAQSLPAALDKLPEITLQVQSEYNLDDLVINLLEFSYEQVDMVTRRGEFAVRGGLIDIFPPDMEHPLRCDFFGDQVESISYFAVTDQRSFVEEEQLTHVTIVPCKEIILDARTKKIAAERAEEFPPGKAILEKISQGIPADGMESLIALLAQKMTFFTHYLPEDSNVVFIEDERIQQRATDLQRTSEEFLLAAWEHDENSPVDLRDILGSSQFISLDLLKEQCQDLGLRYCSFNILNATVDLEFKIPSLGSFDETTIREKLAHWHKNFTVIISCQTVGAAQRLAENLNSMGITSRFNETLNIESSVVQTVVAHQNFSFYHDLPQLMILSDHDVLGKKQVQKSSTQRKSTSRSSKKAVDPLQLQAGDYVVHQQHGLGRFVEMVQRNVGVGLNKAQREYLVIEYAPSKRGHPPDRLFVPADQLDLLSSYVGSDEPTLNKMGGSDWSKTKSRARKAVKQIAAELIRLYSARQASQGHAFATDTPWQQELEDSFPYVETVDQVQSIEEVKRDMEAPIPMDRLISGDVGYGKTEIAVRAAFKAVQDGKQVAVLCPTTILAQQHYETFSERFRGFPVRVAVLSRFQTAKQAKQVMEDVAAGIIDVVIGTHKLLGNNVHFKDLGLVVVDEEQRFGVQHKEKLKKLRTNVDVLAMSATPIPRTLEMAVTGIREMSSLATPPEERQPVLTYVGGYSDEQVVAAIRREMMREGQIFYVHNRVKSIDATAAKIARLVPEARVAVAHGKMSEKELERIIVDFWEQKFDVLVSTTIIETGLDISNANTLIVENADKYGLSQLHQLRGRVGRSRERAYAYFLYNQDQELSETAIERLKAVATHNELGAGMQLAMKDLEIRGAGNLLGAEQSGHIAGVGFDLYLRMVGEAVANYRGEKEETAPEIKIELPLNAYIPEEYINGDRLRLEAYKKIAALHKMSQIPELQEELIDRYGDIPSEVQMLLNVAQLRMQAGMLGINEIMRLNNKVRIAPVELAESAQMRLNRLYPGTIVKETSVLVPLPQPMPEAKELLTWISALLGILS